MARRVLPMPPVPVRVTRRVMVNICWISARSCSRPMKLVGGTRKEDEVE